MEQASAVAALSALAHDTRLSVFRHLVVAGADGLPAGVLAENLNVLPNTLSAHLAQLARVGLIVAVRDGRVIRYAADFTVMRDLMSFLMQDCCQGQPEVCGPLAVMATAISVCADTANDDGIEESNGPR